MRSVQTSFPLPPLRKYILKNSLGLVALFAGLGTLMMVAVFLASGITPSMVHLFYDSLAATTRMDTAWDALRHPSEHPEKTPAQWADQFNQALHFELRNITDPDQSQVIRKISDLWNQARLQPGAQSGIYLNKIETGTYKQMEDQLVRLIELNQHGIFYLVTESNLMSKRIFLLSTLLVLLSIFTALYLADNLAIKISSPLKELAETLRRKPIPGSRLKLPQPTSLEMRIFIHEMSMLWERLSDLRKLNLEEIFSQQKKLEAVLCSVDDAILVLDNQDHVVHCNQGMLELIHVQFNKVLGQPWTDLSCSHLNYLKLRELLKPQISSQQTVELELGGKVRIFSGRCRPFNSEKEVQIGLLYLLHDITEVRQKDRLRTEFIGILSNELKVPLETLSLSSRLLFQDRENLPEEPKKLAQTIHENVNRIRAVADEFFQVGLVDLHTLILKMEVVSMSDYLSKWIQPFTVLARDRNVQVQFLKEGSETILGRIDVAKFPWAISNLLSNAIRVSPPEGVVIVYLTDRESRVDIEVRDEGPGISAEVQSKIFDPYFHGGHGLTGFLGLGLALTKEMVEAHQGRIEYFSRLPVGSIFRISLPLEVKI